MAIDAARRLRKLLFDENREMIGAVADINNTGNIQFFVSVSENSTSLELVTSVIYEDHPEKYVWEKGCLLRCELPIKFPVYFPLNNPSGKKVYTFMCYFACLNFDLIS